MKGNKHYDRIMAAVQPMEELEGPDFKEYVAILTAVREELEGRIAMATSNEEFHANGTKFYLGFGDDYECYEEGSDQPEDPMGCDVENGPKTA